MNSLLVGLGGFLGAISRYTISQRLNKPIPGFPYGTLTVNLVGAFLLGWIAGGDLAEEGLLFFGVGFMGAFTTFSTLHLESIQLGKPGRWGKTFLYLGLTYTGGILIALLGYLLGTALFSG
ncbi:CrcB family protein [Thermoflavimicrobium daqui]